MDTLIGYLDPRLDPTSLLRRLEEAGTPRARVRLIRKEAAVRRLLDLDPVRALARATTLGALAGAGVYLAFALLAAWCQCRMFNLGLAYGVLAFAGGLLAGGLVGGVLGALLGFAQLEDRGHLFIQGIRAGGAVVVVRVDPHRVEDAGRALQAAGLQGVQILETSPPELAPEPGRP